MCTTIGTRTARAARRPTIPAFEEWVWTISNRSRRYRRHKSQKAFASVSGLIGRINEGMTISPTGGLGLIRQAAFSSVVDADYERYVEARIAALADRGTERVLLSAADHQSGDHMRDLDCRSAAGHLITAASPRPSRGRDRSWIRGRPADPPPGQLSNLARGVEPHPRASAKRSLRIGTGPPSSREGGEDAPSTVGDHLAQVRGRILEIVEVAGGDDDVELLLTGEINSGCETRTARPAHTAIVFTELDHRRRHVDAEHARRRAGRARSRNGRTHNRRRARSSDPSGERGS